MRDKTSGDVSTTSHQVTIRLTEEQREQLREKQKSLLYAHTEPPRRFDLDDQNNLPTVNDTVRWLCSVHDARFHISRAEQLKGNIKGYVAAIFKNTPDEECEFSQSEWESLEGVRIIFALAPAAHTWQIIKDEETGERILDDAADPMDITLAVFANGHILKGGSNPQLLRDHATVNYVKKKVERLGEANERINDTILFPEEGGNSGLN